MVPRKKNGEPVPGQQSFLPEMPISRIAPFAIGALLGILFRFLFAKMPGDKFAVMSAAFVFFVPFATGAITVYAAERQSRRTWGYYAKAGAGATLLVIVGTMLILIEGLICAVIVAPLFAIIGAIGGLAMGAVCRFTDWPKRAAYSFAALPLVMGLVIPGGSGEPFIGEVTRTIQINASDSLIWQQLLDTRDIQPREVERAWMFRIGVPLPIAGVTHESPEGLVRTVTMGKKIHFEQVARNWQVKRYVRWQYRFADDSFPPHALDDHVKIGGHYFDLIDTEYSITPSGQKSASLTVHMRYRVSTQFDWYANGVAKILMGNFEETILDLYRRRAENAGRA